MYSDTYSYSWETDGLQISVMSAPDDMGILWGWGNSTSKLQTITDRG